MAKKRRINHDEFGPLTHAVGDLWRRPITLQMFGESCDVELLVDIDPKDGVEEIQVRAFAGWTDNSKKILRACEKAILEYCRSKYDASIRSTLDLRTKVEPEGVPFPYARSCPTLGILFRCHWEEEHGLGVKFENDQLVEVGTQDIVL